MFTKSLFIKMVLMIIKAFVIPLNLEGSQVRQKGTLILRPIFDFFCYTPVKTLLISVTIATGS